MTKGHAAFSTSEISIDVYSKMSLQYYGYAVALFGSR